MDKIDLRKAGNPDQIAEIKRIRVTSGTGSGIDEIFCRNGGLELTLLENRGFDISALRFNGVNFAYLSKNGILPPDLCFTDALDFERCFGGGFLYTCGLDNIGDPRGAAILHGRKTVLPVTLTRAERLYKDGKFTLIVEGRQNQTELYGENIASCRRYTIHADKLEIEETLTNEGYTDAEYMILYHFNVGYPFLDENAAMTANIASTETITTGHGAKDYDKFRAPKDKCGREVYLHTIKGGEAVIGIENPALKMKMTFKYENAALPYFTQWKNMQSGNYVLGIEPASTPLNKRQGAILKPAQVVTYKFEVSFS